VLHELPWASNLPEQLDAPQQNTPSVVKNQDKNHENEKAAPQKAQIESIEDLASTFSTVSTRSGHRVCIAAAVEC
jgi:hypothetical protein